MMTYPLHLRKKVGSIHLHLDKKKENNRKTSTISLITQLHQNKAQDSHSTTHEIKTTTIATTAATP